MTSMQNIEIICTKHSVSAHVASSMVDKLFDAFETALLMRQVEIKLKPFACLYVAEACYTLGIHDIQIYDTRIDD